MSERKKRKRCSAEDKLRIVLAGMESGTGRGNGEPPRSCGKMRWLERSSANLEVNAPPGCPSNNVSSPFFRNNGEAPHCCALRLTPAVLEAIVGAVGGGFVVWKYREGSPATEWLAEDSNQPIAKR